MKVINARNVNDAYRQGINMFLNEATAPRPSRYGNTRDYPDPVTTVYANPLERVLWDAKRDCNPFFHLFESLWMLAGRNDAAFLVHFNKKMEEFADDREVYHGAYGYRWRQWFGFDQIVECVNMLRKDQMTRRCVLTMWSPQGDLIQADGGAGGQGSKDLPCNLVIKFEARSGRLDMIVYNRSNDMIWGAYGANSVHMSFLQEFMSAATGIPVGRYWQVSGNFHVYENVWEKVLNPSGRTDEDRYISNAMGIYPSFLYNTDTAHMLKQIENFLEDPHPGGMGLPFFQDIAWPMLSAWNDWKRKDRARAILTLQNCPMRGWDWIEAALLWMERRATK